MERKKTRFHNSLLLKKLKYGAGFFLLFALIALAILLPQASFEVQDSLLNGKVSLDRKTPPDVMALETGYENSVYRRMANYAEGIDGQRRYYVDEQNGSLTDDGRIFWEKYGAELFDGNFVLELFSGALGFHPEVFFIEGEISLWKQYVVYSDDYAQGVNFVLWCMALEHPAGYRLTILMDAHDYTVYAVRATGREPSPDLTKGAVNVATGSPYLMAGDVCWALLNFYYGVFDGDPLSDYLYAFEALRKGWAADKTSQMEIWNDDSTRIQLVLSDTGRLADGSDGEEFYARQIDGFAFRLPFAGHKLTFDIFSGWTDGDGNSAGQPEITMGIGEIYELIPEFQKPGN